MDAGRKRTMGRRFYDGWTALASTVIGLTSPQRAYAYCRQRNALLAYKAASRKGPDRKWRGDNRSGDAILLRDWKEVTGRARDLVQNSPYIAGAIEKICNNVIFNGIRPQAQLKRPDGLQDRERNAAVEEQYKRWAESPEIRIKEKQELALRHLWQDGELLVHPYLDADMLARGLVPLRLELIEADHLDSSVNGDLFNGNYARRGIEFNIKGDPVAYHLLTDHPGNTGALTLSQTRRIPADQIVHIFKRGRISQTRGVSWLVSVIMRMRGLDEYEGSESIAARLTSAFAFFVESPFPEFGPEAMGGSLPGYEDLSARLPGTGVELPEFVDSGRVQMLPPGAKVEAQGFSRPGDQFEPFVKTNLRGSSAGVGMSYEAFSNDYTDATYSSARSGSLEERRGYRKQQDFINDYFNAPIWAVWSRVLFLSGLVPGVGTEIPVNWQTPGWPWVDPYKDAQAAHLELKLGISNRRKLCAERGMDFDENIEQLAREREAMREAGMEEESNAQ